MKRIILFICFVACLLALVIPTVFAHPGRTDSKGGHTDTSTGEYHYHHGYSAHDHYDIDGDGVVDCPYEFDDKTDHSSRENDSTSNLNLKAVLGFIIAFGIYVFFMFVLPFLMS